MAARVSRMAMDYSSKMKGVYRQETAAIDFQAGWDEANRWIPVTEQMPQDGERVLVTKMGKWTNIGKWININDSGKIDYRWIVGNSNINWDVTHWRRI